MGIVLARRERETQDQGWRLGSRSHTQDSFACQSLALLLSCRKGLCPLLIEGTSPTCASVSTAGCFLLGSWHQSDLTRLGVVLIDTRGIKTPDGDIEFSRRAASSACAKA